MQSIFQKENADTPCRYRIYRHLPTYEKIIKFNISFYIKKMITLKKSFFIIITETSNILNKIFTYLELYIFSIILTTAYIAQAQIANTNTPIITKSNLNT
ncbi:TPA: hypothetical protein JD074_07985 [Clostridioides difficile]|nr:hypothetical protein C4E42_02990 [Clostridioides difficile]AVD38271.1 hypothetical protein C4E26_02445 [Clostridioides difficile]AVD41799.1 hypothetical protein C4E25_02450 [Clostridioides difficile]EGT3683699.1 hypothetical protein [Clostridioides difficile]EGT3719077.1 hypothetical protein [Clostridioides difficile]